MNWYLAPVVVDENLALQVGTQGQVYTLSMVAHIGPESPTECLVGLRPGIDGTPPADWTLVAPGDFGTEFNRLFGRNPSQAEQDQE